MFRSAVESDKIAVGKHIKIEIRGKKQKGWGYHRDHLQRKPIKNGGRPELKTPRGEQPARGERKTATALTNLFKNEPSLGGGKGFSKKKTGQRK